MSIFVLVISACVNPTPFTSYFQFFSHLLRAQRDSIYQRVDVFCIFQVLTIYLSIPSSNKHVTAPVFYVSLVKANYCIFPLYLISAMGSRSRIVQSLRSFIHQSCIITSPRHNISPVFNHYVFREGGRWGNYKKISVDFSVFNELILLGLKNW